MAECQGPDVSPWNIGGRSGTLGGGAATSPKKRSAGLGRGVSRDRRKVSGKAAAGGPGPPRIGPDISHFRAARLASHSHRLSLATKRPRGSGEAGPAGPWPAAARGNATIRPPPTRKRAAWFREARAKKETPPRRE